MADRRVVEVHNLATKTTKEELTNLLSSCGEIEQVVIAPAAARVTYGIVTFRNPSASVDAIREFDGYPLNGEEISCVESGSLSVKSEHRYKPNKDGEYCIYIGRVAWETTKSQLMELFSEIGPVKRVFINTTNREYECTYAFVAFCKPSMIDKAIAEKNHWPLNNHRLEVKASEYSLAGEKKQNVIEKPFLSKTMHTPKPDLIEYSSHLLEVLDDVKNQQLKNGLKSFNVIETYQGLDDYGEGIDLLPRRPDSPIEVPSWDVDSINKRLSDIDALFGRDVDNLYIMCKK